MWYEKSPIPSKIGQSLLHSNSTFQHPTCFPCLVIPSCITYDYPRARSVTPNFSICANYSVLHSKVLRELLLQMTSQNSVLSTAGSFISPCGLSLVLFASLKHIFQFLNHFIIFNEDKPCFSETKDFLQFQARSKHLVLVKSRECFCFYLLS